MGWMQHVANMPEREPVTKGWEAFHTALSLAIAFVPPESSRCAEQYPRIEASTIRSVQFFSFFGVQRWLEEVGKII